jgi:tetratricopeptide (TPR) repeat protein
VEWEEAQKAGGEAATRRLVVSASHFTNEMGDPALDFIGRSIAEQVSGSLRDLTGLVLVARETVAAQEKAQGDKITAAGMVGAEYLAAGRYVVMGDQMQVTAEIVKVADRTAVFSQQFRGTKDQLFDLQDKIAAAVAVHFRTLLPEQAVPAGAEAKGPDPAALKLYRDARELYFRGGRENLEQAIELCEEAVDTDPEFAAAQAALADCYINMYMWRIDPRPIWLNRGERAAQKALETDPNSAPAYRSLGRVFQHRREHDKAEEYFNKAVTLDSKYAEAMCSLGWLYSEKKEFNRALHWAGEAQKVSPSNPDATLLRGLAYLDQRNYANAERTFRELVRLHPEFGRGHLYLGETLQKQGRFEEAKEAFVAAMMGADFDPEALRDLGRLELFLQQWDNARKTFLQSIHEQVFEFAANYYLGLIARMQGDEAAAQATWQNAQVLAERVLAKDPNDHYARLFLGLAKAAQGNRGGYDDIQAVRKVEPNHGELAFFEACAAQLLGDYDQAEACVFEATQLPLGPSSAECAADPHFIKVPAGA